MKYKHCFAFKLKNLKFYIKERKKKKKIKLYMKYVNNLTSLNQFSITIQLPVAVVVI
jgi:hypothetical protein